MTTHTLVSSSPADTYAPEMTPTDAVLRVRLDVAGDATSVQTNFESELSAHGLRLLPVVEDLVRVAVAVQAADTRVARSAAYDEWTRDFFLHIGTDDIERWTQVSDTLKEMLRFLTGDRWRVDVHPARRRVRLSSGRGRLVRRLRLDDGTAALFSGGLDSFVGAVDLLAAKENLAFVGHHASGQGATSAAQRKAPSVLKRAYGEAAACLVRFWVTVPVGLTGVSEATFRGRSFLFIALAVLVGTGAGARRAVIPENGLISLNVPLTDARTGSLSTRTTHPCYMQLWRELLDGLGIVLKLELPYRFETKGEMLHASADQETLQRGYDATMSCAHPAAGRWTGAGGNQHCGYCLPCLVRRAAIASWTGDATSYRYHDLGVALPGGGADLRAVRLALARDAARPPTIARILTAGPLPGDAAELDGYLGVYVRGMEELRRLVVTAEEADG